MLTTPRSGSVAPSGSKGEHWGGAGPRSSSRPPSRGPGLRGLGFVHQWTQGSALALLEGAVVLAVGEGARATGASQPARASPCHPESQQFLPCALRAAEVAEAQGLPEPV